MATHVTVTVSIVMLCHSNRVVRNIAMVDQCILAVEWSVTKH